MWQVGKPLEFWTFAPFIDSALAAIPRKNTIEVRNRALPLVIGVGKPDPPLPGGWDELGQGSVGLIGKDYAGNEYQEP